MNGQHICVAKGLGAFTTVPVGCMALTVLAFSIADTQWTVHLLALEDKH
jgi:hypothetical protein